MRSVPGLARFGLVGVGKSSRLVLSPFSFFRGCCESGVFWVFW